MIKTKSEAANLSKPTKFHDVSSIFRDGSSATITRENGTSEEINPAEAISYIKKILSDEPNQNHN